MKPELKDDTYPLFGKVSVPRMIVAQFDSINHSQMLLKYGRFVLHDLEVYIFRNQGRWWWTIYLCVFVLLREASFISADRYRHARNNCTGQVSSPPGRPGPFQARLLRPHADERCACSFGTRFRISSSSFRRAVTTS